ncbi:unnamed protein product [Didymodactylos carnosus]|uniref:Uncharacterized protein n=1 Tax=Didymodactylos carnosus TaxID=1234261 RepID=A0A813PIJ6_9BILA|nr:unnamed protein product [Didymodactylos carnosus]CAF3535797.1 unnamed protein product [Didymodactylos carnosus]
MITTFLHQFRSIHFLSFYFLIMLVLFYFIQTSTGINPYHYQQQQQQYNSLFNNKHDNDEIINRLKGNIQLYLHQQESDSNDGNNNDLNEQQEDYDDYNKQNKLANIHINPSWLLRQTRNRIYGKPLWISRTG